MTQGGIPFRAALFDLDGTLLDSLGVWRRVDERFFAARGLTKPSDYAANLQGKSFTECARYTIERFRLPDSVEAVMAEWMALAEDAYAHSVPLKPGALAYLRMLKRAGVKLAAATSNRPSLFEPALEAGGARALFDVVCTTAEVGDQGKRSGAVFALAAERLGVPAADCAVFEDATDGILGAKALGMRAYAVRDDHAGQDGADLAALADGVIDTFDDMRAWHAFPENARRCVIFTARCEGDPAEAYSPRADDVVLCADGGWEIAARLGVTPTAVIGDFDSSRAPLTGRVERHPVEKDDTDTLLCLKKGLAMGLEEFVIVGGFGGRLDHTLANLQTLAYARAHHARAELSDGRCWATVLEDDTLCLPRRPGCLSVFALDGECRGVTLRGVRYAAEKITLTNRFPLGVSNRFAGEIAQIHVDAGALLVLVCPEEG